MRAIIEMKEGDFYKYELDKQTDRLVIDRVLSVPAPCGYGFIPGTLSEDGDPLDVFVVSRQVLERGCELNFAPLAGFSCEDNGVKDDKIVGHLEGEVLSTEEIDAVLAKIVTYLKTYKTGFKVLSQFGPMLASDAITLAKFRVEYEKAKATDMALAQAMRESSNDTT